MLFYALLIDNQSAGSVHGKSASKEEQSGRVTIMPQSGVEGSEYINASFIDVSTAER